MRQGDRSSAFVLGGILVLIGAIFLVRNLTGWSLGNWNWWALFILIPAAASLANAWRVYQAEGKITVAARGPLVFGAGLLLVSIILLFGLSWGTLWPVFLILFGVGALIFR